MTKPSWHEVAKTMEDEGYSFRIERKHNQNIHVYTNWAWKAGGSPHDTVESPVTDPVDALQHLLNKCRERWPPKHPWDDLSLEQLFDAAKERGWRPHVYWLPERHAWCADMSECGYPICNVNAPVIALREAMKARERKESR